MAAKRNIKPHEEVMRQVLEENVTTSGLTQTAKVIVDPIIERARFLAMEAGDAGELDLKKAYLAFAYAQETHEADAWDVSADAWEIISKEEDAESSRMMASLTREGKNPRMIAHDGALCILHDEPRSPAGRSAHVSKVTTKGRI